MKTFYEEFGELISTTRKGLGMTRIELERRAGIPNHRAVEKIERAAQYAKLDTALYLCRALNISPETLFNIFEKHWEVLNVAR